MYVYCQSRYANVNTNNKKREHAGASKRSLCAMKILIINKIDILYAYSISSSRECTTRKLLCFNFVDDSSVRADKKKSFSISPSNSNCVVHNIDSRSSAVRIASVYASRASPTHRIYDMYLYIRRSLPLTKCRTCNIFPNFPYR